MTTALNKQWFGYNPPFFGGQQGVMSRQAGLRLIKNDLQQLILTLPGERIMRPTFGTILRSTVFDNITEEDLVIIGDQILEAINTFDTRVNANVSFEMDEDNHVAWFRIVVQVKDGEASEFTLVLEV